MPSARGERALVRGMGPGDPLALDQPAFFKLLAWLSPAFPVGTFAYSSGLEWAVAAGEVVDPSGLQAWVTAVLGHGNGFCDAVFLAHAHRATVAGDTTALASVAELAAAFAASKERFLESTGQGAAFLAAVSAAWPCAGIDLLLGTHPGPHAYAAAVAVASAGHGIAVEPAVLAFLQATATNLVSAAVRLIPLGQTAALRIMAELEGTVAESAARALDTELEHVGTAAFRADLASQHHESQRTRLFRS